MKLLAAQIFCSVAWIKFLLLGSVFSTACECNIQSEVCLDPLSAARVRWRLLAACSSPDRGLLRLPEDGCWLPEVIDRLLVNLSCCPKPAWGLCSFLYHLPRSNFCCSDLLLCCSEVFFLLPVNATYSLRSAQIHYLLPGSTVCCLSEVKVARSL